MASSGPFAEVAPGEVIGGYRLERLLGSGSTSQVYLGTHVRLGRMAAIKVLATTLLDNKDVVSRLLQEARVVNDIHHPNIIDILDFIETETPPRVALVMEYIEGPSLKALREFPFSFAQALGISLQLVAAVQAAHAAGVIHRDIKPDNLLLTRDPRVEPGKMLRLMVVDFGIAKLAGTGGRTAAGMMLGTPAYMAPEQIAGRPPPSAATDVFAIGEVIYELLTSQRAYPASTIHETVRSKLRGETPPLQLPPVPGDKELLALITRCLAFKPQDRPAMKEVRDMLLGLVPAAEGGRAKSIVQVLDPLTAQWLESLKEPDVEPAVAPPPAVPERASPRTDRGTDRASDRASERPASMVVPETHGASDPLFALGPTDHVKTIQLASLDVLAPSPRIVIPPAAETELMIVPRPAVPHDDSAPTNRSITAESVGGETTRPPSTARSEERPLAVRSLQTTLSPLPPARADEFSESDATEFVKPEAPGQSVVQRREQSSTSPAEEVETAPPALERETDTSRLAEPDTDAPVRREPRAEPRRPPEPVASDLPPPPRPARDRAQETRAGTAPAPEPSGERRGKEERRLSARLIVIIAVLWAIATGLLILTIVLMQRETRPLTTEPTARPPHAGTPRAGRVTVNSDPPRARVEVLPSGRHAGDTPVELDLEREGEPLRVRVSAPGYEPIEIDVRPSNPNIWVDLERARR